MRLGGGPGGQVSAQAARGGGPGGRVAAFVVRPRVAVEVGGVGNVEEHRRVVRYRPTQPGRLRVFVLDLSRSRSRVEVVEGT